MSRIRNRPAREAAIVTGLEKMRTDSPASFAKMMRLLARLVAKTQRNAAKRLTPSR